MFLRGFISGSYSVTDAKHVEGRRRTFLYGCRHQPSSCFGVVAPPSISGTRSKRICRRQGLKLSASWDPEGLLPPVTGGHFARRERKQNGKKGAPLTLESELPMIPITLELDQGEGVPVGDLRPDVRQCLLDRLTRGFLSVDLSYEGIRVRHLEPPILTIENFLPPELCDQLAQGAEASGQMVASKIGADNASMLNATNMRRTSTTLLLSPDILDQNPSLQSANADLQARIHRLLQAGNGEGWGPPGKLPLPGQLCYEQLQVACYTAGQHFLSHEDAFPEEVAAQNGFQRRGTLLVYLNDAPGGGATRFDYLDVAIEPRKGRALLFFPAFWNGRPDERTLHAAEDAAETKWIAQQWIASGWTRKPPEKEDRDVEQVLALGGGKPRGAKAKSGKVVAKKKGFGS